MNRVLVLAAIALTGCATNDDAPISAEERAYRIQVYQAMMAGRPAPQPIYQPVQMRRAAPVYVAPTVVPPAPIHRNTTCSSFINGRYITTTCN